MSSGKVPVLRSDDRDAQGWDEGGWRADAACRGEDPELFFPVGSTGPAAAQVDGAKQICAQCPVREACLEFALRTGQNYGIWGGLTEDERRKLRRRRRAAARRPGAGQPDDQRLAG